MTQILNKIERYQKIQGLNLRVIIVIYRNISFTRGFGVLGFWGFSVKL